jgi:hypothetical protein
MCSNVVAADPYPDLEGAQGLLSRFVCVSLGYVTQGGSGVALADRREASAQVLEPCFFIHTHVYAL